MSQRITTLVVLAVVVLFSASNNVLAGDRCVTLQRGQSTGPVALSPGDTLTVYYISDGRPCTATWWSNLPYWLLFPLKDKPFTAMTVFVNSPTKCYWLRNAAVQPTPQSSSWTYPRGSQYFFVMKNYTNGDWVYLQIK